MKQPRRFYWDTSVFITALTRDTKFGEDTLHAACDILRRVSVGEAVIVSSAVLVAEILQCRCTTEQYDQFQATLQSPFMIIRGVDMAVARKAAELRSLCVAHKKKLRLATPDALHMATYLLYKDTIDEIHSYDPDFPSKFAWLGLTGSPIYPFEAQTSLVFLDDAKPPPEDQLDPLLEEGIEIETAIDIGNNDDNVAGKLPDDTSEDENNEDETEPVRRA